MISLYTTLKQIHLTTVAVTATLFVLRGIWFFSGSATGRTKWVRVVPHVNDTLLLLSGLGLVFLTRQYPGEQQWLTLKLVGLAIYIVLGMVAFRFAKVRFSRIAAWSAAILVFALIVTIALTRGSVFNFP